MRVFNRIFNRDYVTGPVTIDAVDQRRQSRALPRTSRPGNQYQSTRIFGEFIDDCRQTKVFHCADLIGNQPQRGGQVASLVEGIYPEPA